MSFKKFKKIKKIKITFFTILFLLTNQIFAQNSSELSQNQNLKTELFGIELSNDIFNSLVKENFLPKKLSLTRMQENIFPYNITLFFPKSNDESQNKKKDFSEIIISFTQEDIFENKDFFISFINELKNFKLNFNLTILITACDKNLLSGNESMSGTESFSELIEGSESTVVIQIDFSKSEDSFITAGANGKVTPLWLTKLIVNSFEQNEIAPKIIGKYFLSLYRLNVFQTTNKISSYLKKDIPAINFSINKNIFSQTKLNSILKTILENANSEENFQNEIHYIPIKFFKKYFYIGEEITIIFLLILIFVSLISYCDLGFIFRKNHSLKTLSAKRLIKTLYRIPFSLFIFFICIELSQSVALVVNNSISTSQEIIFFIKFSIALILISGICFLESSVQKKATIETYNYFLKITSLFNVFIFSAIDISLFYIFTLTFIITTISCIFKKLLPLVITLLISLLPYVLLFHEILFFTNVDFIQKIIFTSHIENFLITCIITPIFISYLKILICAKKEISQNQNYKTNQKEIIVEIKNKLYKNFSKNFFIIQIICCFTILIFAIYFGTKFRLENEKNTYKTSTQKNVFEMIPANYLQTYYVDQNYYSGISRQIFLESKVAPFRTEIFVTGESDNPIFYSQQNFSQTGKSNQVKFELPDYPPKNFIITFTPDNSTYSMIEIYNYYKIEDYPQEFLNFEKSVLMDKKFIKEKSLLIIDLNDRSRD